MEIGAIIGGSVSTYAILDATTTTLPPGQGLIVQVTMNYPTDVTDSCCASLPPAKIDDDLTSDDNENLPELTQIAG